MAEGTIVQDMSRGSLAIAALSTIVEWYDFTLYLYLATLVSRVFFGGGATGTVPTLGGFASCLPSASRRRVGLCPDQRPLRQTPDDVAVGGDDDNHHAGDRAAAELCPGRRSRGLGYFSPAMRDGIFCRWRIYRSRRVSAGGRAPDEARCILIASLASAASEIGGLLAVGVSSLTVASLSAASLDAWGWRIPFLVGAVLAASVWIARSVMQESSDFLRQPAETGKTIARGIPC